MFNYSYPNYSQQIIRVSGHNGANAYNMAPGSSALLLDENDPIVWFVRSDDAGYKTVQPYKIEPYKPEDPMARIEERLSRLEKAYESDHTADEPGR